MIIYHQIYLVLFTIYNLTNPYIKIPNINFSNGFSYELTPAGDSIEYYIDSTYQISDYINNYSDPIFHNFLNILGNKPSSITLFKKSSITEESYTNILISKPSSHLFSCNTFDINCTTTIKDEYKQENIYYGALTPISSGGYYSRGFFSVGYEEIDNYNVNYVDFYIYIDDIFLYFFFDEKDYNDFIKNRNLFLPSYMKPCQDGDGTIIENCPETLCDVTKKWKTNHY